MIKRIVAVLISLVGLLIVLVAPLAHATDVVSCDGLTTAQCKLVSDNKLDYTSKNNLVWDVVRFIFILLGGIAVIMIIVGGIQYATSQGESGSIQKAKNTILYAVVGLAVALFATTIVTFIINSVAK